MKGGWWCWVAVKYKVKPYICFILLASIEGKSFACVVLIDASSCILHRLSAWLSAMMRARTYITPSYLKFHHFKVFIMWREQSPRELRRYSKLTIFTRWTHPKLHVPISVCEALRDKIKNIFDLEQDSEILFENLNWYIFGESRCWFLTFFCTYLFHKIKYFYNCGNEIKLG